MNEVTLNARSEYTGTDIAAKFTAAQELSMDADSERVTHGTQEITTTPRILKLDSSGNQPYVMLVNRDATQTIGLTPGSGTSLIKLGPGEVCCFRAYASVWASVGASTAVIEMFACGSSQ